MIEVSERPWIFRPSLSLLLVFFSRRQSLICLLFFPPPLSLLCFLKAATFHHQRPSNASIHKARNPWEAPQTKVRCEQSKASTLHYISSNARLISSTALMLPSWSPLLCLWIWLLSGVGFAILLIRGRKYYPGENALHLPQLITVNFTGNKVCWLHSLVAIDQNGNESYNLNLPDRRNHSISRHSPLTCATCFPSANGPDDFSSWSTENLYNDWQNLLEHIQEGKNKTGRNIKGKTTPWMCD